MPNWCNNRLKVTGSNKDLANFREDAKGEFGKGGSTDLSLQKLVPCPEELYMVSSGSGDLAYDVKYGDWEKAVICAWIREANFGVTPRSREEAIEVFRKLRPKDFENADKYKSNVDKYGHKDWYDWCCANWGTKWDVEAHGDYGDGYLTYHFLSAWAPPLNALQTISAEYPGLEFSIKFYEEGMEFSGHYVFLNGEVTFKKDCDLYG